MFQKQIFGLDISDQSIEALQLFKDFEGIKVLAYGRKVLEPDLVEDGLIKKPEVLAKNILEVLAAATPQSIETKYCIISLPESRVFSHIFKLPAVLSRGQLKNILPLKAEEVIPFPSSDVYFDFKIIGTYKNFNEVFYVAAAAKTVKSYLEVFKSINLKPIAFDLESLSLAQSLIGKEITGGILIADIGARTTNLNIFDQNGVRLSKTIKLAGNNFTKSIALVLNKNEAEAEELKKKFGFEAAQEGQNPALMILQKEFQKIIAEIKKLINYYQDNSRRKVEKIILAGGSALLPKVDLYLSENFGLPVEIGNPFKNFDSLSTAKIKDRGVLFANVAGLALRGIQKNPESSDINLLPAENKKFKIKFNQEEIKNWILSHLKLIILFFLILIFSILIIFVGPNFYKASKSAIKNLINSDSLAPKAVMPAPPAPVEEKNLGRVIIKGVLNVRSGPGFNYSIIGKVKTGEIYDLLEEDTLAGWLKIQFTKDQTGWVVANYAVKK